MFRRLSIAVMWLILFAIPLQGFAAVTLSLCGQGHHSAPGHVDLSGHGHSQLNATPQVHDDATHRHSHPGAHVSKRACDACASSLAGMATPTQVPTFAALSQSTRPELLAETTRAVFHTGAPERPPRSTLA